MKNLAKSSLAVLSGLLLTVSGGMLTSCDSDTLSARLAKKALCKEAAFRDSSQCVTLSTGYYEVDEAEITQLKQLQNAKMVTCKIETVIEKKRQSRYNWYSGYTYYYEDVEHKFAEVALTKEGLKYKVYQPVTMREDLEELLKANEKTEEEMPDYMTVKESTTTQSESAAPEAEVPADSAAVTEEEIVETPPAETPSEEKSAYDKALEKVNREHHDMLAGRLEVAKVIEVYCPEEMEKNGKGTCKFAYEFVDKTPFGYVLGAPEQHKRRIGKATLTHYEDKGWIVDDIND